MRHAYRWMAAREGGEDDQISRSMILACRVLAREPTRTARWCHWLLAAMLPARLSPSHFQYQMKAKTEDRERVRANVFRYCPRAVAAVLDFTSEEWESLKALRGADGVERNMVTDDIIGALGMENEMIEGTITEGGV